MVREGNHALTGKKDQRKTAEVGKSLFFDAEPEAGGNLPNFLKKKVLGRIERIPHSPGNSKASRRNLVEVAGNRHRQAARMYKNRKKEEDVAQKTALSSSQDSNWLKRKTGQPYDESRTGIDPARKMFNPKGVLGRKKGLKKKKKGHESRQPARSAHTSSTKR